MDARGSAGSGWCTCRSLSVQIKAHSSWGRAPACPSSLPGLHPGGIWAMEEEALHKTLLGVQVCRLCHGPGPKWKLLEHQIPFPPVCFCWASADVALKIHMPPIKFRIFLELFSWDWTFWKYLWSIILKKCGKDAMETYKSYGKRQHRCTYVTYPWRWCLDWKVEKFPCTPWPVCVAP